MSRSRSYDDFSDDEIDVRVRHVHPGPPPRRSPAPAPHFIETVRERDPEPRGYYQTAPVFLQPERTVVRMRSKSRERRSTPPNAGPAAPVIIHNNIVNEHSDSEDYSDDSRRHHRRRHSTRSRAHSRASSTNSFLDDARDKWELEKARRELDELKIANARDREKHLLHRQYREEHELVIAKRELGEIRRNEKMSAEEERIRREIKVKILEEERAADDEKARRAAEEERIRHEIELKRLADERAAAEEHERREREAKEAVEHYKLQEAERIERERREQEEADKAYQRRLQEDLLRSGLDEKDIDAILKKEKIKKDDEKKKQKEKEKVVEHHMIPMMPPPPPPIVGPVVRPTYTRMSLRHLDIETLIYHKIDFELDHEQPGYVIIKRWVPEWEQDQLWEHTRQIRIVTKEKRDDKVVLQIDGRRHHHHHRDDNFEWVRKKERKRSKSPGLLMYLAGGRPA